MNHTHKPLVYIAGPYTTGDPVLNTREAVLAGDQIEMDHDVAVLIPHLSMLWHAISPQIVDVWYERDLHHLQRCDALLRLPGKSSGADTEVVFAREWGIPCFPIESGIEGWWVTDPDFALWRKNWVAL